MIDLKAIKRRCAAATEGPWTVFQAECGGCLWNLCPVAVDRYGVFEKRVDAEFAAHAREDVPVLVAEVERLRGVLARMAERDPFGTGDGPVTDFAAYATAAEGALGLPRAAEAAATVICANERQGSCRGFKAAREAGGRE